MKLFKRTISLAIALLMIISLTPTNLVNAAVGYNESNPILYNKSDTTNFPESPNEGYVSPIISSEWVLNENNVAKITMSLQGKGVQKKTDVVLVIDRSGSMNDKIRVYNNEVPVTFVANDVKYQYYTNNYGLVNNASAMISMIAYVDNSGNFRGYKSGTLVVKGLDIPNASWYLYDNGWFNSWDSLDNNYCVDALISIFRGKKAQVKIGSNQVNLTFPTQRSILRNTTNDYTYSTETKISAAKVAAKKFVSSLLDNKEMKTLNKIGVVSYSSSSYGKGEAYIDSTLSNSDISLNSAIDGVVATGGTHIQAGISKAQELLNSSQANNKYIVVLSDGEPTFSNMATKAETVTSEDISLNYPTDINYKLTLFNSTIKGTGNSYTFSSYNVGSKPSYSIGNNGIPTISQALIAKKSGIEIYSVGFDVTGNDNAIYTMAHVASSADNFYLATDDLSDVFTNIAGKIAKAGTNAKVNNVMGEDTILGYDFTVFKDSSHPVTASQGNALVSTDLKSINWDLGTSNSGGDITETPAVLTYYIKLNVSGGKTIDKNAVLNTGNSSSVVYKNYLGLWCKKDFPPSALTAGNGMLNIGYFLSDKVGNPINSSGVIIPFKDRVFINDSLNQAVLLSTSIKVSDYAKSILGYINQSTIAKNENGITVEDSIIATRATVYLNFPYYAQPIYSISYNGNGNTSGTAAIDSNKYKEGDMVKVLDKGTLVKTGYTFKGWSTTNNGSVTYMAGNNFKMPPNTVTLYAVWDKSQYNLKINYIYEGGIAFDTYTTELNVNQTYSITSPLKNGWTPDYLIVSGTMPDKDITVTVNYKKNLNKLIYNTMYSSKGVNPINTLKTSFDIVENFDYTFGFKFIAGQDAPNLNLIISNNKYTINNFKLYEGDVVVSSGDSFASLDKTKIKTGKTYTVTYSLKCREANANLSVEVTMDSLSTDGVANPLSITSKTMPILE